MLTIRIIRRRWTWLSSCLITEAVYLIIPMVGRRTTETHKTVDTAPRSSADHPHFRRGVNQISRQFSQYSEKASSRYLNRFLKVLVGAFNKEYEEWHSRLSPSIVNSFAKIR